MANNAHRKKSQVSVPALRSGGTNTSATNNYAVAEASSPDKPLTEKQRAFARHWAEGSSITIAARKAGYAVTNDGIGYALARMPAVLKLYEEEKRKFAEAAQMTRKKVIDMQLEAYEMGKLMAEPMVMVASAREIGKLCGFYEPVTRKIEHSFTAGQLQDRVNKMSDADLAAFMGQLTAQAMAQEEAERKAAEETEHDLPLLGNDDDDDVPE